MPSFTAADHLRCFSIFEIKQRDSEDPSCLVVILDMSGAETWYQVTRSGIRQIADRLEAAAKMLQISDTKEVAAVRQEIFDQDASRLADRIPTDIQPIRYVENWRLGRVADAAVLELLVGDHWYRYLIDIVCASNLIVEIRDTLQANFHRGSGTVH